MIDVQGCNILLTEPVVLCYIFGSGMYKMIDSKRCRFHRMGSAFQRVFIALLIVLVLESISHAEVAVKLNNGNIMKFQTIVVKPGRLECKLLEGMIYLTPDQLAVEERARYFPNLASSGTQAAKPPASVVAPARQPASNTPANSNTKPVEHFDPAPARTPSSSPSSTAVSPIKQSGGFFYSFSQSPKIPHRNPDVDYSYQMDKEKFYIYVPKNYDGAKPFGLVAFVNSRDAVEIPPGWDAVLNERNLLFIAAQNGGDQDAEARRVGLTVVGILKMMEEYKIDPSRVFVAVHGEGGRMAARIAFQHPELIRGCIPCSGAEFYKAVKWGGSGYGVFAHSTDMVDAAKRNIRFALITGQTDVHRDEILDLYYGGFAKDGFQAKLFDLPNSTQGTFNADVLGHALEFLESGKKIEQPRVD